MAQIVWGTCLLGWCTLIHVAIVTMSIPVVGRLGQAKLFQTRSTLRTSAILLAVVLALLFGHTVQIWSWSLAFMWMGLFEDTAQSFYFATVTYTTLGYGDIVLGAEARVFATFAAVAGLFTFGVSTAYLIGVLGRILPDVFSQSS